MTLAHFKKRLLRDLKANPKKGAVLGLLLLVAIYFWAPLLGKLLSPGAGTNVAAAPAAPPSQPVEETPADGAPAARRHNWRQVLAWMEQDPLTKPPQHVAFAAIALGDLSEREPDDADVEESAAAAPIAAPVTPESLGLKLSGTLVGTAQRVAIINGVSYLEGRELRLADDVVFVLAEVSARKVVLERGEKEFVLELPARAGGR